jgi:hypothetical protein
MKHSLTGILCVLVLAGAVRADDKALSKADDKDGWISLFDGKKLDGWEVYRKGTGKWKVEDGAIVGTGPASHLFYTAKKFGDLHLKAEVQINDKGNSGMYFRTAFGPGFPRGYEAQINSTHPDPVKTGSLYGFVKVFKTPIKPGEWFTYEVIAKGNVITILVNGKTTVDHFVDKKKTYSKGLVAFQQHNEGSVVKIRKVEVKELNGK